MNNEEIESPLMPPKKEFEIDLIIERLEVLERIVDKQCQIIELLAERVRKYLPEK